MYKIVFYQDLKGYSQVKELLISLRLKKDKNSRVNLRKIEDIINKLRENGLSIGMPYIRKINEDIWEMRPLRNRILFFCYENEKFVLLHSFVKKTNKTPKKEIDKVIREMNNYIKGENNE